MTEFVLDASAVLTLLQNEPGAHQVATTLGRAVISAVNMCEVIGKLSEHGVPLPQIQEALERLDLQVIDFNVDQAFIAGLLRVKTKKFGLSLGDRASLGLGQMRRATVVTADRAWKNLSLGIAVRIVR